MLTVKTRQESDVTDEAIYRLIQESYQRWTENGIDAPFLHDTLEEFKRKTRRSVVFVAIDEENGTLLGTHSLMPDMNQRFLFGGLLAVSPSAQGQGIATRMLEEESRRARMNGYRYLKGTTAVKAVWSVRWHLKNGYRIVGYKRSSGSSCANYMFRKQLVPSLLWDSALFCRCCYLASYVITKLTKDSNGRPNLVGRVLKKIIGKS